MKVNLQPHLMHQNLLKFFKEGDKNLIRIYCLVSIAPIFSEIFESIIYNHLNSYFESHNLISNSQYSFFQGRSKTLAVLNIIDHSLEAFKKRDSVSLVLCDLIKHLRVFHLIFLLTNSCFTV